MGSLHPLIKARMGSEDPARLPDEYSAPTAAVVMRDDFNLTADADGNICFVDSYALGHYKPTATAGVLPATFTLVNHAQQVSFTSAAQVSRTLLSKVEVTYIGAELEAAGYLSVLHRARLPDLQSANIENLHTGSEKTVKAQEGLVTYGALSQAPAWHVPTSSTYMIDYIPLICIVGSGLPAGKKVLRIRTWRWVEFQPKEGDLAEGTREHEPHDPGALGVIGQLAGAFTSHASASGIPGFINTIKGVVNAGYHMVQPMLSNYVVPKARQYLQEAFSAAVTASPLLLGM